MLSGMGTLDDKKAAAVKYCEQRGIMRRLTIAEVEMLTPEERSAHFDAFLVSDPAEMPPHMVERANRIIEQLGAAEQLAQEYEADQLIAKGA